MDTLAPQLGPSPRDRLRALVQTLAEARRTATKARIEYDERLAAWAAQPEVIALAARRQDADRTAAALEAEVREAACKEYDATGSKAPAPGVTIAVQRVVRYDPEAALRWALSRATCLVLDAKAFENLAKRNPPRDGEGKPLVVVVEAPQARITRDLDAALGTPAQHPRLGPEAYTEAPVRTWRVPSSSTPGVMYDLAQHGDGAITCSCPGFTARGRCRHADNGVPA